MLQLSSTLRFSSHDMGHFRPKSNHFLSFSPRFQSINLCLGSCLGIYPYEKGNLTYPVFDPDHDLDLYRT